MQRARRLPVLLAAGMALVIPAPRAASQVAPCVVGSRTVGEIGASGDGEWMVAGQPAVLAGLAWPGGRPDTAGERAAAAWLAEGSVTIATVAPPDRWGRNVVAVLRGGATLQAQLLADGHAVLRPDGLPARCIRAWLAAEAEGRRAGRGLWGHAGVLQADRPAEIAAQDGRYRVVEGRIARVRAARAVIYLNFGTMSGESFTVTLSKRSLRRFEASGMTMAAMEGRRVRVRGVVVGGAGRPRIEVTVPEAMERLD